jgi:hypothetical protein
VLCAVCCVLCAVCCVLCAVCCVLCAVCYVLCVLCVLCEVCAVCTFWLERGRLFPVTCAAQSTVLGCASYCVEKRSRQTLTVPFYPRFFPCHLAAYMPPPSRPPNS